MDWAIYKHQCKCVNYCVGRQGARGVSKAFLEGRSDGGLTGLLPPPVCAAFRRSGRTQREDLWRDKRFYVSEPKRGRKKLRKRKREKFALKPVPDNRGFW